MRTININIYQYNELSEAAKEKAYETWAGNGFTECYELRPILKQLEDYNLELKTWEYDGYNFNYSFQNPCFDDPLRYEYNVQWDELIGKTALKKAMRLYDELTTRGVYYSKRYGKLYWRHNQEDTIIKSRCQQSSEQCFDGTFLGGAFSAALKLTIASKNLKLSYADYIEAAFNALFQAAVDDAEYQASEQCFVENYAYDNEYLESGEIYNV